MTYSEILDEVRTKRMSNSEREHLMDIAAFLAILCDRINDLNESADRLINDLNESADRLIDVIEEK